ncbi:MAG: VanW family protein [Clostridia bacterium]|nr:VanW family protein [Clostridia bacterium]
MIPDKALIPLNVAMALLIGVLVAVSVSQHSAYGEFVRMRDAVDRQTFYEGTTVEGVDVSHMTLSNALEYWKDRVEPRYAGRQVTLDNGMTVTSAQLGYASDYEAVLSAAWSAGRNGSLEERYRMVAYRRQNPAAYSITRVDFEEERVESFAQLVALEVDRPAVDAAVRDFDAQTYAFTFTPSEPGKAVDIEALAADVKSAIRSGGGSVALKVETLEPQVTTEEAQSRYGLIDYAITNASSSSKARLNNIKLAMSFINGMRLAPGETFSFPGAVGERTYARGFRKAAAYSAGEVTEEVGGGICQVSTPLFNAAVKADMEIVERHNHSLTVSYVDKGKDATVDWGHQDLRFTNTSEDDIFICCYLTEDKRVRFGLFGRLLPDGEKITLEAETTEVIKYETEYIPSPSLPAGATYVSEKGRNGYKAEAYKIRWDAQGNRISSELLCKSVYKAKNEVVQYGA